MGAGRATSDADLIRLMPFVRQVAKVTVRTMPSHVRIEDLFSAGYEGLVGAANRYDPDRGVPFEAFAVRRIKGAMLDHMRNVDWLSRRDREQHPHTKQPMSLQMMVVGRDNEDLELSDLVEDPGDGEGPVEARIMIREVLPRLSPRYQWVIVARYWCDVSQAAIGAELGVSGSRVCQIETAALDKMRGWLTAA